MIGTANYRTTTEVLAGCIDLATEALGPLLAMRTILVESDVNTLDSNRVSLKTVIESTYSHIVSRHINPSKSVLNATAALNRHVLKYYGDSSLDEFLREQFLEVPESFAYLSGLVGFDISEIGEKAARFKDLDDKFKNIHLKFNRIGWSNV